MTDTATTILITGVSSGLGRAFATAALDVGHTAVGTVRKEADAAAFTALHLERAYVRILDVTDDAEVRAAVDEVEQSVGPIDLLIANAG